MGSRLRGVGRDRARAVADRARRRGRGRGRAVGAASSAREHRGAGRDRVRRRCTARRGAHVGRVPAGRGARLLRVVRGGRGPLRRPGPARRRARRARRVRPRCRRRRRDAPRPLLRVSRHRRDTEGVDERAPRRDGRPRSASGRARAPRRRRAPRARRAVAQSSARARRGRPREDARDEVPAPALDRVVGALAAGERTPVFRVDAQPFSRHSWYVRLPGPAGGPWAGIIRCEATGALAPPR